MILRQSDIDELSDRYTDFQSSGDGAAFLCWLRSNPQTLMATFQEYVGAYQHSLYSRLASRWFGKQEYPLFRRYTGQWIYLDEDSFVDCYGPLEPSLPWYTKSLEGLKVYDARRDGTDDDIDLWGELVETRAPSLQDVINAAAPLVRTPKADPTLFVSPTIWTPDHQNLQTEALTRSALGVVAALGEEETDLASLHWRTFEELVAEVLRRQGMEIHHVREVPQGGRDIIARAELVPGLEALTIAVEVKHKAIVDRPEVQKALYQNRHYPALLFVTSGRFTAGVLQEAESPLNKMRLFLKDGLAVRELLNTYRLKIPKSRIKI